MLDRLSCAAGFGWGGSLRGMWPPLPWCGWPPAMSPPLPWGSATPCFADGTRILTLRGEIAVERLRVGDVAITVRDDGPETAKVVWIARHEVPIVDHPDPDQMRPVRIMAGAFESGMPQRDLRLSPRQALYFGGVLIEARDLVNGTTVIQEPTAGPVTYNAIELDQHDVMLADGLPVASFLDSGNHNIFEDRRTVLLHPAFTAAAAAEPCAKMAPDGEKLEAVKARLRARAAALGFIAGDVVALMARVDGNPISPVANGESLSFFLPADTATVELVSPAFVPAELIPDATDTRQLGVAVSALTLVYADKRIKIALDDENHRGFHDMEPNGHRWTNGAALIALPKHTGPAVLEVVSPGSAADWARARVAAWLKPGRL